MQLPLPPDYRSVHGSVFCPAGKVATGGGGLVQMYDGASRFVDGGRIIGIQPISFDQGAGGGIDVLAEVPEPPTVVTRMIINTWAFCANAA